MASVIDGRALALQLKKQIAAEIKFLKTKHEISPGLIVVRVGDDPASQIYVKRKREEAQEIGIISSEHHLPTTITTSELKAHIENLNGDNAVNGILVQLPLPKHINAQELTSYISPSKDVDGLHPLNVGQLVIGADGLTPCTPLGCLLLLASQISNLAGLHAVIIGRSNLVGKPLTHILLQQDCTVTVAHSKTKDLANVCKTADILVAAVGNPQLVKRDWVKPGATVIDVGMNRTHDNKLVGDVDFDNVKKVAGAITPVPGGVGPMTVACLLLNTAIATANQHNVQLSVLPRSPLKNYRCLL